MESRKQEGVEEGSVGHSSISFSIQNKNWKSVSIFDYPIFFFLHNGWMFHNFFPVLPCDQKWKINKERKKQLLFSTVNIKTTNQSIDILVISAKTVFESSVSYNDVTELEENSKFNVAINFQFLVFGGRIDQLITVQVTKVPRGEDLSAEVPRRGGEGGGKRLEGEERVLVLVVLVHAALIFRTYLAWAGMCLKVGDERSTCVEPTVFF